MGLPSSLLFALAGTLGSEGCASWGGDRDKAMSKRREIRRGTLWVLQGMEAGGGKVATGVLLLAGNESSRFVIREQREKKICRQWPWFFF